MIYWIALPLAVFMLNPMWLNNWTSFYAGDEFQISVDGAWSRDAGQDGGQFRTSEGMIGPPRN